MPSTMESTNADLNITFRRAVPEDRDAVREALLKFFYSEETVTVCYYNGSEVTEDDMEFSLSLIENGFVTLAIDGASGNIIGLTGADLIDRNEPAKLRAQAESTATEKFRDILHFLAHMCEQANVCERFGVDRAYHIFYIAVDPELRGKSLAKQLTEQHFVMAAEANVAVLSGDITSQGAGFMAQKMGLECVYGTQFNDYRDASGRQIFVTKEPHEVRTFAIKM